MVNPQWGVGNDRLAKMGEVDLAWFENNRESFTGGGCGFEAYEYAVSEGGGGHLGLGQGLPTCRSSANGTESLDVTVSLLSFWLLSFVVEPF